MGRKNAARSIELLQAAASYELGTLSGSAPNSCLYPVYVRAEADMSTRQGLAATAEFRKILDHRGLLWNCATGVLAHLGLARAYAMQGDTAKARAAPPGVGALTLECSSWSSLSESLPTQDKLL